MQNRQTLKETLLGLFDGKNTKAYSRLVSTRPVLYKEVINKQQELNTSSLSETLWCIINESTPPRCSCGNVRVFNTFNLGYRSFCGAKCTAKNIEHGKKISAVWSDLDKLENMVQARNETNLARYGFTNAALSEQVKEKTKNTNLQRYGAESPLESAIIQRKIKETMLSTYGVEFPFQSTLVQQKSAETFDRNHPGVTDKMQLAREKFVEQHGCNPFALPAIKDKIYQDRKEKYGYTYALQSHLSLDVVDTLENKELFTNRLQGLTLAEAAEQLGVNATTIARRAALHNCREIFSTSSRSKWEFKLRNFLLSLGLQEGIDFIQGDRTVLNGKELDFYFPNIRAAIEVGSVFWHSELSSGRSHNYHFDKWDCCKRAGIDLFQYWDFELSQSWAVVESKIKYLFSKINKTIGARRIKEIRLVTLDEERAFLSVNHVQGFSGDRQKTYGAYFNGQLVGIIALAIRAHGVEVVRYATTLDVNYPGLFSKILKFSLSAMNLTNCSVFSYSDNRHSSGKLYDRSGFRLVRDSLPTYYYTKNYHSIENKKKFTKQKIASKFGVLIEDKTEWQLMQELGYDRIWDAGKKLWKLDLTK